jgi:hypothetical protein
MIDYEPISKRVEHDIERSRQIDVKFKKYDNKKIYLVMAVGFFINVIQISIALFDGKISFLGSMLLIAVGLTSSYFICLYRLSIISSMTFYAATNLPSLFTLHLLGLLDVHTAVFFGMILCSFIGMSLSGVIGFVNQMEES